VASNSAVIRNFLGQTTQDDRTTGHQAPAKPTRRHYNNIHHSGPHTNNNNWRKLHRNKNINKTAKAEKTESQKQVLLGLLHAE